ncbi:tyrosine-type recombinase/integrase [Enterococcus faecium]|nr:tyrosine-type recombinase/integrase [Enterococcus faecium]
MKIIKVHGFRKTHATLLFEAGAQVKDVQDRLGHSSSKTIMDIYIKVSKIGKMKQSNYLILT